MVIIFTKIKFSCLKRKSNLYENRLYLKIVSFIDLKLELAIGPYLIVMMALSHKIHKAQ